MPHPPHRAPVSDASTAASSSFVSGGSAGQLPTPPGRADSGPSAFAAQSGMQMSLGGPFSRGASGSNLSDAGANTAVSSRADGSGCAVAQAIRFRAHNGLHPGDAAGVSGGADAVASHLVQQTGFYPTADVSDPMVD